VPLPGEHNIENVLGAITVAKEFGIDNEAIGRAIYHFKPLSHRLENIGIHKGTTFYDDAISTTPDSTVAALRSIPKVHTLILGGQDRGYDFTALAQLIAELNIPYIVFFPDSGKTIETAIADAGYTPQQVLHTSSMKEAVEFAYQHAAPDTVCLLSCASPSYSVFKNFEDKGNQFQQYVKELQ
jgi:UDP-N-acetylmuramoyl-L-alanine---L-glutamate ligase